MEPSTNQYISGSVSNESVRSKGGGKQMFRHPVKLSLIDSRLKLGTCSIR